MMRIFTLRFISVFLLFLSIISWGYYAYAKGEWTPPDIIDTTNKPLEIAGGRTFTPNSVYDTFIVLNQGPQDSLQVYNVDVNIEGCSLANQSNITGFDGPLFGSSHRIFSTAPNQSSPIMIYHSCVIDNFRLKTVKSNNGGLNWDIVTVSPNQVYGSCEVAKDSNDPTKFYVGGCNFVSDTYDIYHSTGFGEDNFQLVWAVPNVHCALTDNVIRATFAVIHDHPVTLFGRNEGGGRQGIFIYRNILGAERIDEDVTSAALGGVIESYIPTLLYTTGYVVVPYQNRERQCVKVAGFVNKVL